MSENKQVLGKHPVELGAASDTSTSTERIKEVLVQLLENAAKYSPPESPSGSH